MMKVLENYRSQNNRWGIQVVTAQPDVEPATGYLTVSVYPGNFEQAEPKVRQLAEGAKKDVKWRSWWIDRGVWELIKAASKLDANIRFQENGDMTFTVESVELPGFKVEGRAAAEFPLAAATIPDDNTGTRAGMNARFLKQAIEFLGAVPTKHASGHLYIAIPEALGPWYFMDTAQLCYVCQMPVRLYDDPDSPGEVQKWQQL